MNPRWNYFFCGMTFFFCLAMTSATAQGEHWNITQLPISPGLEPSINNSNEVVWALDGDLGIYSSVRGKLADSGFYPHLANSGEVVYAARLGGPGWDLKSTTRGRLTEGGIIDVNASGFDVNALGEAVYAAKDTNDDMQIFSTIQGQLTFEAGTHVNPCINDYGEIIWAQYAGGPAQLVSSTRGIIPGNYPLPLALKNSGEICYSGYLEGPPGNYSFPHIFSSVHGAVINDHEQFQWQGSMNDAGTIVYLAPDSPGSLTWHIYKAEWVEADTTSPVIMQIIATPNVLWPRHNQMIDVRLTVEAIDNMDPTPISRIISVTSNARQHTSDWKITGPLTLKLRATHSERVNRIYTIVVECRDTSGNVASKTVMIPVYPPLPRRL